MDPMSATGTAAGLALATGLRAYIPLLLLGAAARYTHLVALNPPYDILTQSWLLIVLLALSFLEFGADKIPVISHVNDVVHTLIRPLAGAVVFAGTQNVVSNQSPAFAFITGLLIALGVHAAKTAVRTPLGLLTLGTATPILSLIEDIGVAVLVVLALLLPVVALLLAGVVAALALLRILRQRSARWLV